jgi:hypothetical protein
MLKRVCVPVFFNFYIYFSGLDLTHTPDVCR